MLSPARILVVVISLACHGALAQTVIPPAVTVQRLAPQLVAFAGSPGNFQNLVSGLAAGTLVQLVTALPDGFTQLVSFTPAAAMAPGDIAQTLEAARQRLIGLGIASPTAEQIGIALMGGVVPAALGGTQVNGVLAPQTPSASTPQNPPSIAAQMQGQSAAVGATAPAPSGVNVQIFPSTQPGISPASLPRVNTSDSPTASGAVSRSPAAGISATPSAGAPATSPGAGSTTPSAPERVPAGTPKASH